MVAGLLCGMALDVAGERRNGLGCGWGKVEWLWMWLGKSRMALDVAGEMYNGLGCGWGKVQWPWMWLGKGRMALDVAGGGGGLGGSLGSCSFLSLGQTPISFPYSIWPLD